MNVDTGAGNESGVTADPAPPAIFAPGLYDIGLEEYLGERAHVSSSGLKRILQSPDHLRRYLNRPFDSTPQLDFGTAVHCALLEPGRFGREYVALPGPHTDLFHEEDLRLIRARGQPVHFITDAQMLAVQGIREQVEARPEIARLLQDGLAERSLFWQDATSGIRCKIRPDLLVLPHLILELKTTFDAALPVFQRTLQMQRYHLSAAMYRQGVLAVTGALPNYTYLVASRHAPYRVEIFVPGADMLQEGERLYRMALKKLAAEEEFRRRYRE